MKIKCSILFLLIGLFGQAQSLKFGVKGGLNYSDPSIVNAKANSEVGYHIGGLMEVKFAKFAIQPELMYSTVSASFDGNVIKSKADVGYLTLPIMAKVFFLKKFSLEAGPQVSYALTKSTSTSFSGFGLGEILKVNDFDFGIAGGLGFNITSHYFVQARGVYGLTEVTKKTQIAQVDSFVVKNRIVQLSVGYKF